jgi:ATP-binding cassette subfamily C (CFTR/MRP) protein 4
MLIGELLPSSGTVVCNDNSTVAYASQEPFIMSSSIRENILMGKEYDADFYQQVVEACSLKMDFEQMLDGKWTVVDGSQLSGGQKSRIGLARA